MIECRRSGTSWCVKPLPPAWRQVRLVYSTREAAIGATDPVELLLRIGASVLCGGLIGLERELRRKPAGLRTMMLVSIGSAVFALIGIEAISISGDHDTSGELGRVLQGIIAGLGMLGAGLFLQRDTTIRLATSGAGVWLVGAIGIACGLGLYLLAGVGTALALIILAGIGAVERKLPGRKHDDADDH